MSKHIMMDLEKPEQIIEDHLSELLRVKARGILREALELEMEAFMKEYQSYRLSDGRQRVVRHGYHQDREIQTGNWFCSRESSAEQRSSKHLIRGKDSIFFQVDPPLSEEK